MRKLLLAASVSAVFSLPLSAFTETAVAAEPASPHTLTGNFGIFSQYIFRGLTQTNTNPAAQGGFDYTHGSGLYAGTWLSNISWLTDSTTVPGYSGYKSAPLEWDIYGGYRGTFGKSNFGYDVGLLQYYYPGSITSGGIRADTL
ncbi:MAG: TorF family putative porin, partial [Pseudomonadota bacterium]